MSSETSTKQVRLKADAASDPGLQPWQFFVLAALGCATAVTFIARGRGPAAIILLSVLMATAAFVGFAALRMLRPLVSPEDDRTAMIGQRTRVALEREKTLALRSIKELEFDKAMGKISETDFADISSRLRARALSLMADLDRAPVASVPKQKSAPAPASVAAANTRSCAACGTVNDTDARFCKSCGSGLGASK